MLTHTGQRNPGKNDLVDSPNITGSIEVSGETRKGVADYGLDFSSTPYEPFKRISGFLSRTTIFYNTGTSNLVIGGFESAVRDKVAIVIDCNPSQETQLGFTSAARFST